MGRANPADQALALCVDEQMQGQALERTHRRLPLGPGYAEGVTHDYFRPAPPRYARRSTCSLAQ